MPSEPRLDPIEKLTDPKKLRAMQFARKMNWDSVIMLFWLAAIVCPVVFAFQWHSIAQILKLCHIPLSVMAAGVLFNFRPLPLWFSNIVYFVPFAIVLAPVAILSVLLPEPAWFQVVIPIQFAIYWKVNRDIPWKVKEEWRRFTKQNNCTAEDVERMLQEG